MQIRQSAFLSRFTCLGDQCEDTCCKGWGMQVDPATIARYSAQAPELLEAVTSGETQHVMRRDPETDHCVKFEKGWCGIQKKYGTDFLGDACHFYPRVTRNLGGETFMTASLSCPAIVQLAVIENAGFDYKEDTIERPPSQLKDYAVPGITPEQAASIHNRFLQAALDEQAPPERIMARLGSVSRSLQLLPTSSWSMALDFYFQNADSRLPEPEVQPEDPFHLLHALAGLLSATRKSDRPRLREVIDRMQTALGVQLKPDSLGLILSPDSAQQYQVLRAHYNKVWAPLFAPLLRRYIAAQLSLALFPFAGLGATLDERITIIGVRLATTKLALMCHFGKMTDIPPAEEINKAVVKIIQSLSRFLDHLSDPALSLKIYEETGWIQESRLRGLLE